MSLAEPPFWLLWARVWVVFWLHCHKLLLEIRNPNHPTTAPFDSTSLFLCSALQDFFLLTFGAAFGVASVRYIRVMNSARGWRQWTCLHSPPLPPPPKNTRALTCQGEVFRKLLARPKPKNKGKGLHALLARKSVGSEVLARGRKNQNCFSQLGTKPAESCKAMPESALKQNQCC